MTDDPADPAPADRDLQAAEYVLGALTPPQARALEAMALTDPTIAASIAAWENRLAPMADLVAPVPPPPLLWRRLALATGLEAARPALGPTRRAWRSPGLWRGIAAGSMAIAASLAFLLFNPGGDSPGRAEPLTAVLAPGSAPGGTFLVRVAADGSATVVALGDIPVPQGRALELWAVAGASAPVSLGLLPQTGRATLRLAVPPGTLLLVSQEQAGGSPTRAPTTAPIFAGRLTGI